MKKPPPPRRPATGSASAATPAAAPATPAQPVTPPAGVRPARVVRPATPVQPATPVKGAKAAKAASPAKPAKPAKAPKAAKAAKAPTPVKAAEPATTSNGLPATPAAGTTSATRAASPTRPVKPPSPPKPAKPAKARKARKAAKAAKATTPTPEPLRRPAAVGPSRWLAGLLAGMQAALLSWLIVVIPAVAAFTATSAADLNQGVTWLDAARFASDLWVLGHFGWTTFGSGATTGVVTLAPLGLALVSLLGCRLMAAVSSAKGWALVGMGTAGFTGLAAVFAFVCSRDARPSALAGTLGAGTVAAIGLLWGNAAHGNAKLLGGRIETWLAGHTVPEVPAAGRAVKWLAGGVLLGALVLTAAWALGGAGNFRDLYDSLTPGTVGGIGLVLLCLAWLPNLVLWAVAYISATGFHVGAGTGFSPYATDGGPLPALPLFGLLPATAPPSFAWLIALVPVLAGTVAGLRLYRRLRQRLWWQQLLAALVAVAVAAAILGVMVSLAGGAAGPGRMAAVGANSAVKAGLALAGELGFGVICGTLVLPRFTRWVTGLAGFMGMEPGEQPPRPVRPRAPLVHYTPGSGIDLVVEEAEAEALPSTPAVEEPQPQVEAPEPEAPQGDAP